mgnify:CR=1 FL=1
MKVNFLAIIALALTLTACAGNKNAEEELVNTNQSAQQMYEEAKNVLDSGLYNRAIELLKAMESLTGDEATGARLVAKSLEAPLKQIAENAGMEGGVVVEKVKSLKGSEGLNAATGVYEDLIKIGVIDAAKVTRSALQNAASIAALFLTTEVVIADKPEDSAPMPGGGMEDY